MLLGTIPYNPLHELCLSPFPAEFLQTISHAIDHARACRFRNDVLRGRLPEGPAPFLDRLLAAPVQGVEVRADVRGWEKLSWAVVAVRRMPTVRNTGDWGQSVPVSGCQTQEIVRRRSRCCGHGDSSRVRGTNEEANPSR